MSKLLLRYRVWRLKRLIAWYVQQVERHQVDHELLQMVQPEVRAAWARMTTEIWAIAREETL
jgi:hypothetical protein